MKVLNIFFTIATFVNRNIIQWTSPAFHQVMMIITTTLQLMDGTRRHLSFLYFMQSLEF